MKKNIVVFLALTFVGVIMMSKSQANDPCDDEEISSPLMMEMPFEGNDSQSGKRDMRSESSSNQAMRGEQSNRSPHEEDKGPNNFDSDSAFECGTKTDMISSHLALDAIKTMLASSSSDLRLFSDSDGKNLVVDASLSGAFMRFVITGDSAANQKARSLLRKHIADKYDVETAKRACPFLCDQKNLNVGEARRIIQAASVIHQQSSNYPLGVDTSEKNSLSAYTRDTTLVAHDMVLKFSELKTKLTDQLKSQGVGGKKFAKALAEDPSMIRAQHEAAQAIDHAVETAVEAVQTLEKITAYDSSFGVQVALAAAQHHVKMLERVVIKSGQERNLDYKAMEALEAASVAHEAYQTYQKSQARDFEKTMEPAVEKKIEFNQALKNMEALHQYASEVTQRIDGLARMMQPSCGSEIVPIQLSSERIKFIMTDALTKTHQAQKYLKAEENFSGETKNQEDEFCRRAAVQRLITSTQKTEEALKTSLSEALETTSINAEAFFVFKRDAKISYLNDLAKAQQEYQSRCAE